MKPLLPKRRKIHEIYSGYSISMGKPHPNFIDAGNGHIMINPARAQLEFLMLLAHRSFSGRLDICSL